MNLWLRGFEILVYGLGAPFALLVWWIYRWAGITSRAKHVAWASIGICLLGIGLVARAFYHLAEPFQWPLGLVLGGGLSLDYSLWLIFTKTLDTVRPVDSAKRH